MMDLYGEATLKRDFTPYMSLDNAPEGCPLLAHGWRSRTSRASWLKQSPDLFISVDHGQQ
jgi:hypothetical protein